MKIIFFGSSHFALPSFKALVEAEYDIACVVTQPDRARGRGMHLASTLVKELDKKYGIQAYQPEAVNSASSVKFLKNLKPDIFIVIAYGQILSAELLSIPKLSVNLHASLLPRYRGAAPINWAIINGEKESGVTIIKMSEKMDAGDILFQKKISIGEQDTAVTLEEKMSEEGAKLLLDALKAIEGGFYKEQPQDKKEMSLAPKLKKADGLIDWSSSAQDIHNLIRGAIPWPGAFTHHKGKLLKIFQGRDFLPLEDAGPRNPGEIVKVLKDGLAVATGKGDLIIEELQIEGKRRMNAQEFIQGHKIREGDVLSLKR